MRKAIYAVVIGAMGFQSPVNAAISTGPAAQLEVGQVYDNPSQLGGVYLAFPAGSMPGCYGDAGGILLYSEPSFSRLYSVILTLVAGKPLRGSVLYEVTGQPTSSWDACYIKGIWLRPRD